jgi:hypothetical protein
MPVYSEKTITVAASSATTSGWIPLNQHATPFNVGFGCVVDGTVSYRVEHTFDDVQNPSVTPVAFTHEDVSAASQNADGNYAFPVRAVRVAAVTAATGGSIRFTVLQAG